MKFLFLFLSGEYTVRNLFGKVFWKNITQLRLTFYVNYKSTSYYTVLLYNFFLNGYVSTKYVAFNIPRNEK